MDASQLLAIARPAEFLFSPQPPAQAGSAGTHWKGLLGRPDGMASELALATRRTCARFVC